MTNPMILKLMSSFLNSKTSINGKTFGNINQLESVKGKKHFLSDMLKAFQTSKNGAIHMLNNSAETNASSDNKRFEYYLESIKKELLSQGKPLNKAFLKEKDLPLIKTFLLQCGFSNEKVEKILKDLKENDSGGEINLSQIFLKITELGTSKNIEHPGKTLEPSAVPYIESVLRDFNLTPKELDSVFNQARVEGGGLGLDRLIEGLKKIKGRSPLTNKTAVDQRLSDRISEKMEVIGLNKPINGKNDQITLEDFITSLKQMTKNTSKEQKVSSDIKSTLNKIVERVEVSEKKATADSFVKVSSNYNFTEPLSKEEINKKSNHAFNDKAISSLEKTKFDKIESLSSMLKQKDVRTQNHLGSEAGTSNYSEKADLLSALNKKIEFMNPMKEKGYQADTKAGQINLARDIETFNFADSLNTVEHGEKSFRGYIPDALVDQIGKQISRSMLRGDRVVTLQLKPPELGKVRIKMDIKDHTLKLGMITEHHSVKELLLNNVHELKEALVQHGIKLERVDVQSNYNFGQSLNASKEGTSNEQGGRKDFNGERFHSDDHTEGSHERVLGIRPESNLLDLIA